VIKTCRQNETKKNTTQHFFGTITYFEAERSFFRHTKLVLIDGQQRITTTMLFLASLRDILKDSRMEEHVKLRNFIEESCLLNPKNDSDEEFKIKLKQVEADWAAYKNIICGIELNDEMKESAVYRNYRYFRNHLSEYKGDFVKLVDYGLNQFSVITIELEPDKNTWENPQEIFESMNSIGKPLSLADLVRNYLLLGIEPHKQDSLYGRYWLPMEQTLPGQVSNYIRDFMQLHERASYKKATENNYKELYGIFKAFSERYNIEGHDSEAILRDLYNGANSYAVVIGKRSSGHQQVDNILKDLRVLNITTAYSFLMALLSDWENKKFSSPELIDILDVFRIYSIRRRLIKIGGAENKNFPLLVSRIDKLIKSTDKRKKFFEILTKQEWNLRLPNDLELTKYFETANFFNHQHCRFLLALLEEKITKSRPNLSDSRLQVEHIMPQTLNDEWRSQLGPDCDAVHQELVHTIGNLTLIRHNQELGNRPFNKKKSIYESNSGLQIARTMITNRGQWNAEAIKERAEWIIHCILDEVLPIPDEMRKSNNFANLTLKDRNRFSFEKLGLIGKEIYFLADRTFMAKVVDKHNVEFEGKTMKLSPLTREIQTRLGRVNPSGSYQGSKYWGYGGKRLADYEPQD
jgi:uncharacterized protein with ParB-like and HNH nuclease domain